MYLGCRGCAAKIRWAIWTLAIIAAAALLAAGLQRTIPALVVLFKCTTKENSLADSGSCWKTFWADNALFFILSCIGAGCLLLSLLTCCCFCCAKAPGAGKKDQQFQQGGGDGDAYGAPADNQYKV